MNSEKSAKSKPQASQKRTKKKTEKTSGKELRLRQMLRALPDGVLLFLKDWTIDWMNPIAERDLGFSAESNVGKNLLDVCRDAYLVSKLKSTEENQTFQLVSSESRILEVRVISAGSKFGVLITRDITGTIQVDDFRRDFVANVSHELRTPLTVIKGFLEVSEISAASEQEKLHHRLMSEQVNRMTSLVDDLLTLSRLERDSAPAARDVIDLMPLLTEAATEGRLLSQDRHTIVISGCSVQQILGDRAEMRSALTNLVTNAVRYTPKDGTVTISAFNTQDGLVISVKDNGIGIAPEHIPRVTERFFRVDKSRSRETGGTGLGLAIVKHVLLRHHARLKITSTLGKGSDFQIIFSKDRLVQT